MTIGPGTTISQLQVELGKHGITALSWCTQDSRHIVMMHGVDEAQNAEGFGQTFVEALDDAWTAWVHALGAMLARAD